MVMSRFQHFAIAVVRDMSTVEWFSPRAVFDCIPRLFATTLFACSHPITGYSGNSSCPYSFQIPNLQ